MQSIASSQSARASSPISIPSAITRQVNDDEDSFEDFNGEFSYAIEALDLSHESNSSRDTNSERPIQFNTSFPGRPHSLPRTRTQSSRLYSRTRNFLNEVDMYSNRPGLIPPLLERRSYDDQQIDYARSDVSPISSEYSIFSRSNRISHRSSNRVRFLASIRSFSPRSASSYYRRLRHRQQREQKREQQQSLSSSSGRQPQPQQPSLSSSDTQSSSPQNSPPHSQPESPPQSPPPPLLQLPIVPVFPIIEVSDSESDEYDDYFELDNYMDHRCPLQHNKTPPLNQFSTIETDDDSQDEADFIKRENELNITPLNQLHSLCRHSSIPEIVDSTNSICDLYMLHLHNKNSSYYPRVLNFIIEFEGNKKEYSCPDTDNAC